MSTKLDDILNKPEPSLLAKPEIKALIFELIGEDQSRDTSLSVQGKANMTRRARNTFRAELREKVNQL